MSGLPANPRLRRIVGALALVAFLLLVVVSAAHAGEADHAQCDVCTAASVIVVSFLPAPTLDAALPPAAERLALAHAAAPAAATLSRSHAPRAPPVLA